MSLIYKLETFNSLKNELNELKDYLGDYNTKLKSHSENLIDQIEIRTDSVKSEIDNSKKILSEKVKEFEIKYDLGSLNFDKAEGILASLKSKITNCEKKGAAIDDDKDNFEREASLLSGIINELKSSLKSYTRVYFDSSTIELDTHILGHLSIDDNECYIIQNNQLCKITLSDSIHVYHSFSRFTVINEDQIFVLGMKTINGINLDALTYNFKGYLVGKREFSAPGNVITSHISRKLIFLITTVSESSTTYCYLSKFDHYLNALDHVNIPYRQKYCILRYIYNQLYVYDNGAILVYDNNFKLIQKFGNQDDTSGKFYIFNVIQLTNQITVNIDEILIFKFPNLKLLSKNDESEVKIIEINHNALVTFAENFYVVYDCRIFKNLLLKKDYSTQKVLGRYRVEIPESKKVTDISIDDKNKYVSLWCQNTDLFIVKIN